MIETSIVEVKSSGECSLRAHRSCVLDLAKMVANQFWSFKGMKAWREAEAHHWERPLVKVKHPLMLQLSLELKTQDCGACREFAA